jgi:hypothetical protein
VKKLFLFSTLVGAALGYAAADPEPIQWLILGANQWNAPRFDQEFLGSGIQWTGFDLLCLDSTKCIKGDFNSEEDLEKLLKDNWYDVIYFDGSTAKYIDWNKNHLEIITKKLKDPGLLLIPVTGNGFIEPSSIIAGQEGSDNPEKAAEMFWRSVFRKMVANAQTVDQKKRVAQRISAINNQNIFVNGSNALTPISESPEDRPLTKSIRLGMRSKGLNLLKRVFNNNAILIKNPADKSITETSYPPMGKPLFKETIFYVGLHSNKDDTDTTEDEKRTETIKNTYKKMIFDKLMKDKHLAPELD